MEPLISRNNAEDKEDRKVCLIVTSTLMNYIFDFQTCSEYSFKLCFVYFQEALKILKNFFKSSTLETNTLLPGKNINIDI